MSDQYVAEIRIFPFNFAPIGWQICAGQILPISQYSALFSLLGTNFGGNGTSNFGLPNLQGNVPVDQGQGSGLSPYAVGQSGGNPTVTVLDAQNPIHNHLVNASTTNGNTPDPSNAVYAKGSFGSRGSEGAINLYTTTTPGVTLKPTALNQVGSNQPHNNMMPYLVLNFCIALQGIFPPRG